jgi:S-phase kinase-associated protein 1
MDPNFSMPDITLVSDDKVYITVEQAIIRKHSPLIHKMLVDLGNIDDTLPIPGVKGSVLKKVVEWCTHHRSDDSEWDRKFMQVDQEMLSEIVQAAEFLVIKDLYICGVRSLNAIDYI